MIPKVGSVNSVLCLSKINKGRVKVTSPAAYPWPPFLLRYISEVLHTIGKQMRLLQGRVQDMAPGRRATLGVDDIVFGLPFC